MSPVRIRTATPEDLQAITAISVATGQDEEWSGSNPVYVEHLMRHGRVVVAEAGGTVIGFGAVERIGTGPAAITMLCDLFVDPAAHGRGAGRAMLGELWGGSVRRMTFSSLHAHAVPLYTSFGLDAWWPLLYLRGPVAGLPAIRDWSVSPATAAEVGALERAWTGIDRTADHAAWAAQSGGAAVVASHAGQPMAAGTVAGPPGEHGIVHLAAAPDAAREAPATSVLAVLGSLEAPGGVAQVCLPAPHPAVRALLAARWRVDVFDLFMATEPGLLDPRRAVPSPGQA